MNLVGEEEEEEEAPTSVTRGPLLEGSDCFHFHTPAHPDRLAAGRYVWVRVCVCDAGRKEAGGDENSLHPFSVLLRCLCVC